MSAPTLTMTSDSGPVGGRLPGADIRVTQARVFRSEWLKLITLPSSWYTFFAAAAAMIGIDLLVCWAMNSHWSQMGPMERLTFDPIGHSLRATFMAQLIIGVLGVLFISGEYGTGMIRSTLGAVPRRLPVLWAKLSVFVAATFVVAMVAAFASFFGGQALLGVHGTTLSAPGALRSVFGAALYLCVVSIFSMGIGFAIRNTAGGIATVFGLLLILPGLVQALPHSWEQHIFPYLPSVAGSGIYVVKADPGTLAPWTGFGVFCIWAVAAVIAGAWVLVRRDA